MATIWVFGGLQPDSCGCCRFFVGAVRTRMGAWRVHDDSIFIKGLLGSIRLVSSEPSFESRIPVNPKSP